MNGFDVAIVGAGVHGLAVANALCDAGRRVVVLEKGTAMSPRASSGPARIIRCSPHEGAEYASLMALSLPGWQAWQRLSGTPLIDWIGALLAGPAHSALVASGIEASERNCAPYEYLTAAAIVAKFYGVVRVPANWHGALQGDAGVVRADTVLAFLRDRLERKGGVVVDNCAVSGIADNQPVLSRPELKIGRVGHVVVCIGPWYSDLFPRATTATVQEKWVASVALGACPGMPTVPAIVLDDDAELFATVFHRTLRVGSHRWGATVASPEFEPSRPFEVGVAADFFPALASMPTTWERCWYTFTTTHRFSFSSHGAKRRILAVQCCNGHGFKYAPAVASIVCDWVERKDNCWLTDA